jgi:hypothetical protein
MHCLPTVIAALLLTKETRQEREYLVSVSYFTQHSLQKQTFRDNPCKKAVQGNKPILLQFHHHFHVFIQAAVKERTLSTHNLALTWRRCIKRSYIQSQGYNTDEIMGTRMETHTHKTACLSLKQGKALHHQYSSHPTCTEVDVVESALFFGGQVKDCAQQPERSRIGQKLDDLTKPLCRTPRTAATNSMANADLLASILLLEVLESVHIKLPIHRLPLLPSDLLLLHRIPQLFDSIPPLFCEPVHIIIGVLGQYVNGSLRPDKKDKSLNETI